MMNTICERSY